ncbi:MAG: DUF624 domain-containing protein [Defluviitaleaceae bacterium]|nr:DUF624 domain-containing protein [Defluviitaleaceae bacterium]
MGIFNIDGPFYKIGSTIADILIIGLMWLLLAVPIFTIGASTTAAYYVFTKRVSGKEGYLWRDFWQSFRQNFLTATAVWLTILVVYAVLAFNVLNANLAEGFVNILLVTQFIIFVQISFIAMYAFPLISRFEMGYRTVFKTAFFLANRHILLTIANAVLLAVAIVLSLVQPVFAIPAIGLYLHFSSFFILLAFKKYRPDLDEMVDTGALGPLNLDDNKKTAILDLDALKKIEESKK